MNIIMIKWKRFFRRGLGETNKDKLKLTPQQIGGIFLEMLKSEVKRNLNTTVKDLTGKIDIPSQVDLKHIKDELVYLNIYIIYQALFNRFKSHFDEIEECFKKELKQFLEEQASGEFALISMINVNNAIIDYMKQYNNAIAKEKDRSSGLRQFTGYITRRVLGRASDLSLSRSMYMMNYYGSRLLGLTKLIDDTIELNSEE